MTSPGLGLDADLERAVAGVLAADRAPLALLDIDLTLLDNAPRTRAIFGDWLAGQRGSWAGAEQAMIEAQTMPIVFGVMENLTTLGVADDALRQQALQAWMKAFFSDRYCGLDQPLPGALAAVGLLRGAGVTVAYVTARPQAMLRGTVGRLVELGFPIGVSGTLLSLKPDMGTSDDDHKEDAFSWLATLGGAVLCADNEPGHANQMHARFPAARTVLVDTRHSPGAPALDDGISRAPSLLGAISR